MIDRRMKVVTKDGIKLDRVNPSPLAWSVDRCRPFLKVFASMISCCTPVCGIEPSSVCPTIRCEPLMHSTPQCIGLHKSFGACIEI